MTGSRKGTRPRRDGRLGWQKLADWLGELAFLAETEGFVPGRVERLDLRPDGLSGWGGLGTLV